MSSTIVQKIWNFCNTLSDDGISYGDYLEQLTLFRPVRCYHLTANQHNYLPKLFINWGNNRFYYHINNHELFYAIWSGYSRLWTHAGLQKGQRAKHQSESISIIAIYKNKSMITFFTPIQHPSSQQENAVNP